MEPLPISGSFIPCWQRQFDRCELTPVRIAVVNVDVRGEIPTSPASRTNGLRIGEVAARVGYESARTWRRCVSHCEPFSSGRVAAIRSRDCALWIALNLIDARLEKVAARLRRVSASTP